MHANKYSWEQNHSENFLAHGSIAKSCRTVRSFPAIITSMKYNKPMRQTISRNVNKAFFVFGFSSCFLRLYSLTEKPVPFAYLLFKKNNHLLGSLRVLGSQKPSNSWNMRKCFRSLTSMSSWHYQVVKADVIYSTSNGSFNVDLKGLSYEIDFENVDENWQILA